MKRFTILNLLIAVALIAALLSWIPAIRRPRLPDGYVWSHRLLKCEYPATPPTYPNSGLRFSFAGVNQEFDNGTELYRYYFNQGWWICRRNFFEGTDGYPFEEPDWEYLDSADSLPDDHLGKYPQFAMRDGCRACSRQIDELLASYTAAEIRARLIDSAANRYGVPIFVNTLAAVFLVTRFFWRRRPG